MGPAIQIDLLAAVLGVAIPLITAAGAWAVTRHRVLECERRLANGARAMARLSTRIGSLERWRAREDGRREAQGLPVAAESDHGTLPEEVDE